MPSLSVTSASRRIKPGPLFVWTAAAALAAAACYRYFQQPTFWLDEAFVAVSLRSPSLQVIFAQLEYGQIFPRIYLAAIAILREAFGYRVWSLRLLPFLSFIVGTLLWARLLIKRSRPHAVLGFLAAALLIGATFWLDQAIQLKQYTFDVMLALTPFVIDDSFFEDTLIDGKRPAKLIVLALPCVLSYTYPFALGARVVGWYLQHWRSGGWRFNKKAALVFGAAVVALLAGVWFTDHRFNIKHSAAYLRYWNDCILGECLKQNAAAAPRLMAKFLWGWHGRQPLVTAVLVPLQVLGVYAVIRRVRRPRADQDKPACGSQLLGSLVLLIGVIAASTFGNYPICGGRVVLFTQIHTQLLAIEGASLLLGLQKGKRVGLVMAWILAAVVARSTVRSYRHLAEAEPAENLRPVISLIKSNEADTVLVHNCSVAQVRSLPEPLPVSRVVVQTDTQPKPGEKMWVVWTHLGADDCVKDLDRIRAQARSWQVVHEGPGRGLALAEF